MGFDFWFAVWRWVWVGLVICDFGCFSGVWLGALRLFGVRLLVASLFVLRGFVFVCGLGGIMVFGFGVG